MKGLFTHSKPVSFFLVAMVLSQTLHAENQDQTQPSRQVYFEAFGSGIVYSVNFESKFAEAMDFQ